MQVPLTSPFEEHVLRAINNLDDEFVTPKTIVQKLSNGKREEKMLGWVQQALDNMARYGYVVKQQMELPAGQTDVFYEYSISDAIFKLLNFDEPLPTTDSSF